LIIFPAANYYQLVEYISNKSEYTSVQ